MTPRRQHRQTCEPDAVRRALQAAVARGRTRPAFPAVSPVPHRMRSPLPDGYESEELELCVERDHPTQAWMPLRILYKHGHSTNATSQSTASREQQTGDAAVGLAPPTRRPVVVFLHPTGSNMNEMRGRQEEYAYAGYLTVAVDCRYHGERAHPALPGTAARAVYEDALVSAWRGNGERPFLLDNVWDLQHVLDYLLTRPDVDAARIGVTGFSLGGMHAWLLAAADVRVCAAAAVSGVQSFGWAVANDAFQARVASIPRVFEAAREDMGRKVVDANVVAAVWALIAPGLDSTYDAPASLPLIAPRPLLIASGELDGRCPLPGLMASCAAARGAWVAHEAARIARERSAALHHDATVLLMSLADSVVDDALAAEARLGGHPAGCRAAVEDLDGRVTDVGSARVNATHEGAEPAEDGEDEAVRHARAPRPPRAAAASMAGEADAGGVAGDEPPAGEPTDEDELARAARLQAEAAAACEDAICAMDVAQRKDRAAQRAEASAAADALLMVVVEKAVGHTETARMQRAVREFFDRHLLGHKHQHSVAVRNATVTDF